MSRLVINSITKHFPGVKALTDVSLTVQAGEVHALCGENGAGKSTLMNILSGNLTPDSGSILLNGREMIMKRPQDAFANGIATVHQHLSLTESLSIAENIFANEHPVSQLGLIKYKTLFTRTTEVLRELDLRLKPDTVVNKLSPSEKQLTEIAKALAKSPKILILDEPTASLTDKETERIFRIIRRLAAEGVSVIYISHRLNEIEILADRVSILKDGVLQGTFEKRSLTRESLIRGMVGRDVVFGRHGSAKGKEVIMEVTNLEGSGFKDVNFKLFKGEILGFAGLAGAGRTEIARALFGADHKKGSLTIHGKRIHAHHSKDALLHRIGYVPEERKALALFEEMSVAENIAVAGLENSREIWYRKGKIRIEAESLSASLRIATPDLDQKVAYLSGGNQQKVVLARWLLTDPDILIVDEPTHGVDVGAKSEIYTILRDLARRGKGIIIISSELPELLALCDRILIVKNGRIAGELDGGDATEEKIMQLAT